MIGPSLEDFRVCLRGAHPDGNGGLMALCPAHDDHNPSLHCWINQAGKAAFNCMAGCEWADVNAKLIDLGLVLNGHRDDEGLWTPRGPAVSQYRYTDERGELLYVVCRTADKQFPVYVPDPSATRGKRWKLDGTRRVLYRLPMVLAAAEISEMVFVVEGEKDVHALEKWGLIATTNAGGAGKWLPDYSVSLKGAQVALLPDNDKPGRDHMEAVWKSLRSHGVECALLEPVSSVDKGDVSDAIADGMTSDYLLLLAEEAFTGNGKDAGPPAPAAPPATTTPAGPFNLTELGNAERMAAHHKGSLYAVRVADVLRGYDPARGIYSAEHGLLVRYATATVRSMYAEAGDQTGNDPADLRKYAHASESRQKLDAMLTLAKSLEILEAEVTDFDCDPELLNTRNGVVNLRTGELYPHDPKYRMTRMAGCEYEPGTPTPIWDAFLDRIFEGDPELIAFLQRLFGYALTGYNSEQIFAIFHGSGANGKSVLVDCWHAAMGAYAGTAAMKTFLPHKTEAIRTDLATFAGQRLVSTSESKAGQVIDAATIKRLTSRYVTCRFNYDKGEFTYTPNYLIILDTNFKPNVSCDDYAIKRRVLLVPFGVKIPDEERDDKLTDKLIAAELPGILAWGVAGAVDYLENRLQIPGQVRIATDTYRAEMDALSEFWGKRLAFDDPRAWTSASDLRDALNGWAKENGVDARDLPSGKEWGRQLRERGATDGQRKVNHKVVAGWNGVQIAGAETQEEML